MKHISKRISVILLSTVICCVFCESTVFALSKIGSRGQEVTNIQTRLKSWGYYSGNIDGIYEDCKNDADRAEFEAIEEIDKIKYIPESEPYCKILVNGQEPDTRGVRSLNKNGRIWGAVICILERLKTEWSEHFDFEYNSDEKILTLKSGEYVVTAECGRTHLLVNGNENLMDGEPYISDSGQFVMEVSAIASYIDGVSAWYDDKVEVFRIETKQ